MPYVKGQKPSEIEEILNRFVSTITRETNFRTLNQYDMARVARQLNYDPSKLWNINRRKKLIYPCCYPV